MLSKAQIKYIRSLTQQKYRKEYNVFAAEGDKIAEEWLRFGQGVKMIVALEEWLAGHLDLVALHPEAQVITVTEAQLQQVSQLHTANKVLLVVTLPVGNTPLPSNEWTIALDDIQDPGNMGTIIRTADWFGIHHIVCSPNSVDVYNSKVIQAAMGSHLRIRFYTSDLHEYLNAVTIPVIAAVLDGDDIYKQETLPAAVLLIGNEGKGLDTQLIEKADKRLTIPAKGGAESLNAAVSTGILCALLTPR